MTVKITRKKKFQGVLVRCFKNDEGMQFFSVIDLRKVLGCSDHYIWKAIPRDVIFKASCDGSRGSVRLVTRDVMLEGIKTLAEDPGGRSSVLLHAAKLQKLVVWFEAQFPEPKNGLKEMPPKEEPEVVEAELVNDLSSSWESGSSNGMGMDGLDEEIPEVVDADSMALVVVQRTNEIMLDLEHEGGQVFCSSLDVATRFGKQHKDVIRKIESSENTEDFNRRNFTPISYTDAMNRSQPAYRMTRDGFSMLAMGFTGKEATLWREAYIAAFNAMEKKLRETPAPPSFPTNPADLLVSQAEMHLAMAKTQAVHEKRLMRHDERLAKVEFSLENLSNPNAGPFSDAFHKPEVKVPDMNDKARIAILIDHHVRRLKGTQFPKTHQDIRNELYSELYHLDSIQVGRRNKQAGQSRIDTLTDAEMKVAYARLCKMYPLPIERKEAV